MLLLFPRLWNLIYLLFRTPVLPSYHFQFKFFPFCALTVVARHFGFNFLNYLRPSPCVPVVQRVNISI